MDMCTKRKLIRNNPVSAIVIFRPIELVNNLRIQFMILQIRFSWFNVFDDNSIQMSMFQIYKNMLIIN